jgi:hypothetical protein
VPLSRRAPKLVVCAGLKSSASTWLYNVILELLKTQAPDRRGHKPRVVAFYAEDPDSFPAGAERADYVVVKTHIPSPALQALVRFVGGTVFITVREPRDAIASLMQRFHHRFDDALREVAAGSRCLVELRRLKPHVLRYEQRFFDNKATIARVARQLGVKVPQSKLEAIHRSLTRDKVKSKIATLTRSGRFGRKPDPDRFDPATHWHPGHVGDGTSGKYAAVLSERDARAVLAATRQYRAAFGYGRNGKAAANRAESRAEPGVFSRPKGWHFEGRSPSLRPHNRYIRLGL